MHWLCHEELADGSAGLLADGVLAILVKLTIEDAGWSVVTICKLFSAHIAKSNSVGDISIRRSSSRPSSLKQFWRSLKTQFLIGWSFGLLLWYRNL